MRLRRYAVMAILALGVVLSASTFPQTANAVNCPGSIASFPTWYRGLTDSNCNIRTPSGSNGLSQFIWTIVTNVIDFGLHAVMYISALFIIYGGFLYMTSNGSSDRVSRATQSIFGAVIGLVISIGSIAAVNEILRVVASVDANGIPVETNPVTILNSMLSVVYWLAGIVDVIFIVLSGIRFITGGSNTQQVQKARSGLTYSVIGLVVVIVAFTITNFVLGRF